MYVSVYIIRIFKEHSFREKFAIFITIIIIFVILQKNTNYD